jgi:hypothetical protein
MNSRAFPDGRIRSIEKSYDLIGNQTCELPGCSIAPQPTASIPSYVHIQLSAEFTDLIEA